MQLGFVDLAVGGGGLFWDIEMDRPGMLHGPVVAFALGLYDVTAWSSSLVNSGAGDVFIFAWGQEQHFLART